MTELFHKIISCPVLARNYDKVFSKIVQEDENPSFLTLINSAIENANSLQGSLGIYDLKIDLLAHEFQIPDELKQKFSEALEAFALIYILNYSYKFAKLPYEDWLKQLHDLERTAAKLQSKIPKTDANFYEMLSYFDHFEDEPEQITPKEFFNDALQKLEVIKNLRHNVINSNLGKVYGFNQPSRKKNHALNT